jgi:magnesium transporter
MRISVLSDGNITDHKVDELPALLANTGHVVWMDALESDAEAIRVMTDVFKFHPLAIEDTNNHHQRPKLTEYDGYVFLIVNAISVTGQPDEAGSRDDSVEAHELDFREVDMFVGRNYVVTVHLQDEPVIDEVRRRVSAMGASMPVSASYLAYVVLDTVVDGYFPIMDMIEEEIGLLEDIVLMKPRQENLTRLFEMRQMLINLWRVVWPQRDILSTLTQPHVMGSIGQDTQYYLRDVADHLLWIADMIAMYRDTLTTVIDLHMSSVSNQLNRVVNRLTVFTLVIGILTVISGFYGMNFETTWPQFGSSLGVPFVLFLMALLTTTLLAVLRRLGWF